MTYFEKIINIQTGIEETRQFTNNEIKIMQENEKNELIKYQEFIAKENARQSALAKLAALGLTEDEIAAL